MISRPYQYLSRAVTFLAILGLASPGIGHAANGDVYVDRNFGFSFSMPRFTPAQEKNATTVAVTLAGPPVDSFAPNVNVMVQNLETTLEGYREQQAEELRSIGWEVVEQSQHVIGETPALRTHARGSLQGLAVEFLAVAMIRDDEKVFVLTCTTTAKQFPYYRMEFDRVVSTFSLGR